MNNAAIIIAVISLLTTIVFSYLQWSSNQRRVNSGEALDWSTAMRNMREENEALRLELKQIRSEMQTVKELARRLIKNPPERGEVIVLTPIEQALLYDTGPRMKGVK